MRSEGDEGAREEELITNAQCPMPNAPRPMLNAHLPKESI
ncbi:histidine kinase [Nostoc sp. ChiVER01]|nr:histidine kinase [Nostoc sp. ChiVER01]MDZ8126867.1 histidine kinase [Nostoc sp. CmiVER01]MDZ8222810.1 histidine kinase [Nostoc sp. ChiVER01]